MKQRIKIENLKTGAINFYWSDLKIHKNKGRGNYIELCNKLNQICAHAPASLTYSKLGLITSGNLYKIEG